MTSQENTEVARQLVASFADRGVDGVISFFDAAVEWTTATDEPDHQTYVGHSGIRRLYATWNELWEAGFEADVEAQDFIALNEHVVVPVKVQVRGRSSSVEVEIQETYGFTFVSGKITRVREFRTAGEALDVVDSLDYPGVVARVESGPRYSEKPTRAVDIAHARCGFRLPLRLACDFSHTRACGGRRVEIGTHATPAIDPGPVGNHRSDRGHPGDLRKLVPFIRSGPRRLPATRRGGARRAGAGS